MSESWSTPMETKRPSSDLTVRRLSASTADKETWAAVRTLCCQTGDNGNPVSPERWAFFGRLWIEPYEKLLPEWTYVGEIDGRVVGYLTGCADTRSFNRRKHWRCAVPLLAGVVAGRYRGVSGAGNFARGVLGLARGIEERFDSAIQKALHRDYPAHLHINLDARYRRQGFGRRLIEQYLGDLRAANVPGIHLLCGPDPVSFYRWLGFQELARMENRGTAVFLMAKHCTL